MLTGFADEICGTLARLIAYVMMLALIAIWRYRRYGTGYPMRSRCAVSQFFRKYKTELTRMIGGIFARAELRRSRRRSGCARRLRPIRGCAAL